MCRFAVYVGEPIAVSTLLLDTEHSLYRQSYNPKELVSGSVNADGFGFGWYDLSITPVPACYRRTIPIWADTDLPGIAKLIRSHIMFANVRNATDSSTTGPHGAHPFYHHNLLFMHNGFIESFRGRIKRSLQQRLSDESYAALLSTSDSETIFRAVIDALKIADDGQEQGGGRDHYLVKGLIGVISTLKELVTPSGLELQLNLALSDGHSVVCTRWANTTPVNSLYLLNRSGNFDRGIVVASEPLTPGEKWEQVPEQSLVLLNMGEEPSIMAMDGE